MKRIRFLLICVIFGLVSVSAAYAQDAAETPSDPYAVSDEMIRVLSGNLDNIYPISSLRVNFMAPAEALYSDVGPDTMVRKERADGKQNILIAANNDGIHDHNAFDGVDAMYPSDFRFTMDVTLHDVYPKDQGGCFIGFTNEGLNPADEEAGLTVNLLTNGEDAVLYLKTEGEDAGVRIPLGKIARTTVKLSDVHLTRHTIVFVNGTYMGQFHDGLSGGFRLIYGASLFPGGDLANCSFDNLAVRKVNTK